MIKFESHGYLHLQACICKSFEGNWKYIIGLDAHTGTIIKWNRVAGIKG